MKCKVCGAKPRYRGRWGQIKAQDEGWFSQRDGVTHYCPQHVPDWVGEWREKKEQGK